MRSCRITSGLSGRPPYLARFRRPPSATIPITRSTAFEVAGRENPGAAASAKTTRRRLHADAELGQPKLRSAATPGERKYRTCAHGALVASALLAHGYRSGAPQYRQKRARGGVGRPQFEQKFAPEATGAEEGGEVAASNGAAGAGK